MTPKQEFYTKYILDTAFDGWGTTHDLFFYAGRIGSKDPIGDRMWGQFFYARFVDSLDDESQKINLTNKFLTASENMLVNTKGIFLRDITLKTLTDYRRGDTGLEASKDQMLGFVGALFVLYQGVPHEVVRIRIRRLAQMINDDLLKHNWFLYNERENRKYDSANYCHVHYVGISTALNAILGNKRKSGLIEAILHLFVQKSIISYTCKNMVSIKNKKKWWQNISFLKKYAWYGEYFRAGVYDFNLNLCYFEMYILATTDARDAKWVLDILTNPHVMQCNNLNFAYLFFRILKDHPALNRTSGVYNAMTYYRQLRSYDDKLHPDNSIPNSWKIGGDWYGQDVLNSHEITQYDKLVPNAIQSGNPMPEITGKSCVGSAECSNGLFHLSRL